MSREDAIQSKVRKYFFSRKITEISKLTFFRILVKRRMQRDANRLAQHQARLQQEQQPSYI